jgi:hypothetical protein
MLENRFTQLAVWDQAAVIARRMPELAVEFHEATEHVRPGDNGFGKGSTINGGVEAISCVVPPCGTG